jgi:anthranilate phosphoribosyltransferase
LPPEALRRCVEQANICFAFARSHHPAMKHVGSARTSLGIPTIFNLLGPLTNPGKAKHQLLGVFAPELTDRLATVLKGLGSTRAWVVNAMDGLDEISTMGPTRVSDLRDGHVHTHTIDPRELGLPYARLSDLQVNDVDEAARMLRSVLDGNKGPAYDIAALNAAAALVVAGRVSDLHAGLTLARDALDSGSASKTLESLTRASHSHA